MMMIRTGFLLGLGLILAVVIVYNSQWILEFFHDMFSKETREKIKKEIKEEEKKRTKEQKEKEERRGQIRWFVFFFLGILIYTLFFK